MGFETKDNNIIELRTTIRDHLQLPVYLGCLKVSLKLQNMKFLSFKTESVLLYKYLGVVQHHSNLCHRSALSRRRPYAICWTAIHKP